jgi:NADP-dependent 3-hydroxy acid dehydrogenase YdfG
MSAPVLLIIGAGPRLGEAVARRFGRDGYDVALIARDEQRLADLGGQLKADGITAGWTTADIGDAAELSAAIGRFVDYTGRVDVLLHNVSVWRDASTLELAPADLLADLSIGAASLLTAAQAVVPSMRAAGRGTILATGSGVADRPSPGRASLGTQKAALRALVQALDADLRPEHIHCATVTVRGPIKDGTDLAPERIADVFAELAAETSPDTWRTVVDLP